MKTVKKNFNLSENERIEFATKFLRDRIDSLKNDCTHCLFKEHPAPFPALLYCFSTVDLLGALYFGDGKGRNTQTIHFLNNLKTIGVTQMSQKYMKEMMNYDKQTINNLQGVFRHKLVHLAIPNPAGDIAWREYHKGGNHLLIEDIQDIKPILTWPGVEVEPKKIFNVSIWDFVLDIERSALGPSGFLEKLKNDSDLQKRFDNAVHNIYFGTDLPYTANNPIKDDDLEYELRMLLGAAKLCELFSKKVPGNTENYFKDAVYLHARNLYNFFSGGTKNDASVHEFTNHEFNTSLYGEWKEALHNHVLHLKDSRNTPTNIVNGRHLNTMTGEFAADILILWQEWIDNTTDPKLKKRLEKILKNAQKQAKDDYDGMTPNLK